MLTNKDYNNILKDKVFISTREKDSSKELFDIFTPFGASILEFPMIETSALPVTDYIKSAVLNPNNVDWIIFNF